jgi:membrane protein implicated in regulation of membrane protease activity
MGLDTTIRRRILGGVVLMAALIMLAVGLTVLWGRLPNFAFLAYWLVCIVLTGLAMVVAILDTRALRERTRREERALLENTLKDIVDDARKRPQTRRPDKRPGQRA